MYAAFYAMLAHFADTGEGVTDEGQQRLQALFADQDGPLTPPDEGREDWFPGEYDKGLSYLRILHTAFQEGDVASVVD